MPVFDDVQGRHPRHFRRPVFRFRTHPLAFRLLAFAIITLVVKVYRQLELLSFEVSRQVRL